MTKEEVYKVIETERDYQDSKWGETASSGNLGQGNRTIDEFSLYVAGYANDLVQITSHSGDPNAKLDVMRKIAALCVACFEQHGCPERKKTDMLAIHA